MVASVVLLVPELWVEAVLEPKAKGLANVGVPLKFGFPLAVVIAAVGMVTVPVNVGLANGARLESKVPESCTFPKPSVVTTSPEGAACRFAAAVAAVVVLPDPATVTVPVVVIGPPVAIPAVLTCVTVPAPPPLLPGTNSIGTV